MQDGRVARRYARALFEAAKHFDLVRGVEDDLDSIVAAMRGDPNFRHFLIAPDTNQEEKLAIVERIFSDRITGLTMRALRVMVEKGREAEIEGARDEYVALRRADAGIVYATITTAMPLDEGQKRTILDSLGRSLAKSIEGGFEVDPRLLGGVRVSYENHVLDGSVRGGFSRLRSALRQDLLKQA